MTYRIEYIVDFKRHVLDEEPETIWGVESLLLQHGLSMADQIIITKQRESTDGFEEMLDRWEKAAEFERLIGTWVSPETLKRAVQLAEEQPTVEHKSWDEELAHACDTPNYPWDACDDCQSKEIREHYGLTEEWNE